MRLLHTADWHLGKRLEHISRFEEQQVVLEEICVIAEIQKVDVVLIAGDIFDAFNPPTEAVELFYKTVKRLSNHGKRAVIAIAGNHDSPDRIEAPDPLARECGILLAGYPHSKLPPVALETGLTVLKSEEGFIELQLPNSKVPLRLLLTPYANEYRLRTFLGLEDEETALRRLLEEQWTNLATTYCDEKGVNVLLAHLFMMKKGEKPPEEPDDEKPILHVGGAQAIYTENIPPQIQYTALGHLHRYQHIDKHTIYSSSPLSYSFGEANQQKYVMIVDIEPNKEAAVEAIPLQSGKPLVRKRFESIEETIVWLEANPETLVELTIVTDDYLKADDRKRLQQAHQGIITIIPEMKNPSSLTREHQSIDLNQKMDDLFRQYFQFKHGQKPNSELMELFKEIQAQETEE